MTRRKRRFSDIDMSIFIALCVVFGCKYLSKSKKKLKRLDNACLKKDCIHLLQAVVPPVPPRRDYVVEGGTKVYSGKHPREDGGVPEV